MLNKLLLFSVALFLMVGMSLSGDRYSTVGSKAKDDLGVNRGPNTSFYYTPLILEGQKDGPDYWITPEVAIDGLTGYYDYETNGENKHQINRYSSTIMHAIKMTSTDSTIQSDSRRTVYAFSDDDGTTWSFVSQVPLIRSGFCALDVLSDGSAFISNHNSSPLNSKIYYDLIPGIGSFTEKASPYSFVWPGCATYSNGNKLICGETYRSGAATDTGYVAVYNTTSNTFTNGTNLVSGASSQLNMRWTYAGGPGGKGIYVLDAISDVGGPFGLNRMYIFKTTDNGVTWDAGSVLVAPQIIGSDTIAAFFGLDAIYDAAGNYYVAFNTLDPGNQFASAKMWVTKNGATPVLVAQHSGTNGIPEAANLVVHADAGISTIDHPALSLSADGSWIFVAFSVQYENDTLNNFNKCHIYYSGSQTSTLNFFAPIKVTNSGPGSFDERYPSINRVAPDLGGNQGITLFMLYQKDPQPGSCAFNDLAPVSRSYHVFRKIHQANTPIGIVNIGTEVPGTYALHQNFPNPFNPETKIKFELPKSGNVSLKVFNSIGQQVAVLANNEFTTAGYKEVSFNASNLPSGVYFYSITAGDFSKTLKMVLVK